MNDSALSPLSTDKTLTATFGLSPDLPLNLSLSNTAGNVHVTTGDDSQVQVVIQETSRKNSDVSLQDAVLIQIEDNDVTIRPNFNVGSTVTDFARRIKDQLKDGFDGKLLDFKNPKSTGDVVFDIHVTVPASLVGGSKLTMRTASGDVHSDGFDGNVSSATASGNHQHSRVGGDVSSTTASGDIRVGEAGGNVECNSASGDVQVSGATGWIAARSVSGNVRISESTIKGGRFNTVSGDILVDATFPNATAYSTETVSGSVRFTLRVPESGAQLSFRSLSGSVNVSPEWQRGDAKRTWKIGQGEGPDIRVKSVSGNLSISAKPDGAVSLLHETREQANDAGTDEDAHMGHHLHHQMPHDVHPHEHMQHQVDLEHAKNWVKDITDKVTKFVGELDAAGDRQRSQQAAGQVDVTVEPASSDQAPTAPVANTEANPYAPMSNDPTTPIDASQPAAPATPPAPQAPEAPEAPAEPMTQAEAAEPVAPPEPATTGNSRLELLEAVQRGEITVEEALRRMDGGTN